MPQLNQITTSDSRSYQRVAGMVAILSALLAFGSLLFSLIAVRFNMDAFSEYLLLLYNGAASAEAWRWAMILDMLGYYLLIVPAVLWLQHRFAAIMPPWTKLATICVLGYSLIGAIGAAVLATTIPPLLEAYAAALPAQQFVLETVFSGFSNAVYGGLWNLLEQFVAGAGWLIFGVVLLGTTYRRLGWLTLVLGAACLTDSLGSILKLEPVALIGMSVYLILAPAWAGWLGFKLLKVKLPQAMA